MGSPRKGETASMVGILLSRFRPFSWRNLLATKALTMHARISYSRFVKTLGFSVLPGGTGQRRKLRPEMSSHHEKSVKAKTMKGN